MCVMEKLRHGQAVDIPNYDLKSYKNNVFPARRVQLSYLWVPVGIILHITAFFLCKDPLQISSEWQLLALIVFVVFVVVFLPNSSIKLTYLMEYMKIFIMITSAGKPFRCYTFGRHTHLP